MFPLTPRIAVLAVAALAAGCAHYRLGARPPSGDKGDASNERRRTTVAVASVAVPAEWGVDANRLTRHLDGRLASFGLRTVGWARSESVRRSVRCSVDGPPAEPFDMAHTVRVDVRCRLFDSNGGTRIVRTRASAAVGAPRRRAAGTAASAAAAYERASLDALGSAARDIAETLDATSSDSDD